MIDEFITEIENTFGKYKSGMKKAITDKMLGLDENGFDDLLRFLIEDYDMARPPSLKVIMGECYRHKISLNHEEFYGVSVCEFCGQEFSQSLIRCPKCEKIRKYGLTRLVRYKPVWIDFEADDEKRFIEKWNRENNT